MCRVKILPDRIHNFISKKISNILRKHCYILLIELFLCTYCFPMFTYKIFPPFSVQEMLTGQRLCQSSSHNDAVLAALNQQRSDGILCDITLIAEEQKFHAHKAVLAACSDYFRVSLFLYCSNIKNYPECWRENGYPYHTEQNKIKSL